MPNKNQPRNMTKRTQFLNHFDDQLNVPLQGTNMTTLPVNDPVVPNRYKDERGIFEYLEDPKATATLPSLKSVLNELEVLTQKNNMRLDDVTQLVQVDQGMSLRVLRMANSVYYSPSEPIMDVREAI
jgi:hypothetical protein